MVESEWNIAMDTGFRLAEGLHRCNQARWRGDWVLYLKALYHLYMELGTWMSAEGHKQAKSLLGACESYQGQDWKHNMNQFMLAETFFRREADRHKLLLKTAEDTRKHGG